MLEIFNTFICFKTFNTQDIRLVLENVFSSDMSFNYDCIVIVFRYNTMRVDPTLCFLERCGPPEENAAEKAGVQDQDEDSKLDNDEEDR